MTTMTTRLLTREEMTNLKAAWLALKPQDCVDNLLYALLREKDPLKCFTPISRPAKLANGHQPWQGLACAARRLRMNLEYRLAVLMPEAPKARLVELQAALAELCGELAKLA